MNNKEARIEHHDPEILIQTIPVQVLDEDEEGVVFNGAYSNTGFSDRVLQFVRNKKSDALDSVNDTVVAIAKTYGAALKEIPHGPNELEIELSISISTKGEVCIVSAESKAMMKVKMSWKA